MELNKVDGVVLTMCSNRKDNLMAKKLLVESLTQWAEEDESLAGEEVSKVLVWGLGDLVPPQLLGPDPPVEPKTPLPFPPALVEDTLQNMTTFVFSLHNSTPGVRLSKSKEQVEPWKGVKMKIEEIKKELERFKELQCNFMKLGAKPSPAPDNLLSPPRVYQHALEIKNQVFNEIYQSDEMIDSFKKVENIFKSQLEDTKEKLEEKKELLQRYQALDKRRLTALRAEFASVKKKLEAKRWALKELKELSPPPT